MTNSPADLLAFRAAVQAETGLHNPSDVGIVGDGIHAKTGGYHEGRSVLVAIGLFHASAAAGSSTEDYSARLARDRAGLTEEASAVDIGSEWPRGGRAAWLRFNRLLFAGLQAGDPALSAVRAINYSLDGETRHRIDREHGFGVISDTSDSVTIHTHTEFYRDTAGRRQATLDRIVQLIRAAVANSSAPVARGDRMLVMAHEDPKDGGPFQGGEGVDWIGDGLFRWPSPDPSHTTWAKWMISQQGGNPTSLTIHKGTLDALGPIVLSTKNGVPTSVAPGTIDQAKVDALIAAVDELKAIVAALPHIPTLAEIQEAARLGANQAEDS